MTGFRGLQVNMEADFFDSLFEGDSANGVKLGMGLTCGDFWPRPEGCQCIYRGASVESVDFATVLGVGEVGSESMVIPDYIQHLGDTVYYYVIRRVNNCGQQEQTLLAAVKVAMDSDGDVAKPKPNNAFGLMAKQVTGSRAELLWYYWPIGQKSVPVAFNVYWDNGSGQIDYENALATIDYCGKKFYCYQSSILTAGRYEFVVSAEGADGVESDYLQAYLPKHPEVNVAFDFSKAESRAWAVRPNAETLQNRLDEIHPQITPLHVGQLMSEDPPELFGIHLAGQGDGDDDAHAPADPPHHRREVR